MNTNTSKVASIATDMLYTGATFAQVMAFAAHASEYAWSAEGRDAGTSLDGRVASETAATIAPSKAA